MLVDFACVLNSILLKLQNQQYLLGGPLLKRAFDVAASLAGLALLSPLFAVVAVLIKWESPGPVFFSQVRIGRGFRPFKIYKFRSMVQDSGRRGPRFTAGADPRITRVGRWLRSYKIDELPQLANVLRGDMSLVGPRPEIREYVRLHRDRFREVLRVRPGITDLASIKFRSESEILGSAPDPSAEYAAKILPEKLRLAEEYARRPSLLLDLQLIFRTLARLF